MEGGTPRGIAGFAVGAGFIPALPPQMSDSPSSNLGANTKKTFKTYDTTSGNRGIQISLRSQGGH